MTSTRTIMLGQHKEQHLVNQMMVKKTDLFVQLKGVSSLNEKGIFFFFFWQDDCLIKIFKK